MLLATLCTVHQAVCFCVHCWMSDDSPLTEPWALIGCQSGFWQICWLTVPSVCTRLLRLAKGESLAPHHPPHRRFSRDDNDKQGGVEWVGCENPLQSLGLGSQSHSMCSWKSSSMRTSRRSAGSLCTAPASGLSLRNLEPNVQNIQEVIFGKVSSNR